MIIGNKLFDIKNHTYIMGILNVTPDSFSDGGNYSDIDKVLFRVEEMIKEGVDIIDIGGESTRPGYDPITVDEEINRVVPVIEKIKNNFDIPISLDTYKSEVALCGIKVGVDMINDIWGLKADDKMAQLIADYKVVCCLMHNRKKVVYDSFIKDVVQDLEVSVKLALDAGILKENIMIDPGVGFGKNYEDNLRILRNIDALKVLDYPILLGVSRKSVIGFALGLPIEERLNGTLALSAYGVMKGCSFLRVHDIKQNKEVVCMLEAFMA